MIKQKYLIKAPIEKVWEALVSEKVIDQWGGGPVKMDDKAGSKFSLWGGDVWGKNIEVIRNKKLVQDWYGGDWKKLSKVTFILKSKGGSTEVDLIHTDVPRDEESDFADGWKDYYLGEIKKLLEV